MAVQEIQENDWAKFCRRFSQLHQGTLVTVELLEPNGNRREIARDIPLASVEFDPSDACSDKIRMRMGHPHRKECEHIIDQPIHLRLKQNGNSSKVLQIEAENGTSLLTFHSGKIPETLEGLAVSPGSD